jgi:hypothetical protein
VPVRKKVKLSILAVAMATALAACGGGGSSSGSPTPSGRPSSPATVKIVFPTSGTVIHGSTVHLKIKLTGAKIVAPTTTHIVPTRGHIHVLLDGKIQSMNYGINIHAIHGVKPGNHLLQVEFVASDHRPWDPRVVDEVTFEVKK